MAADNWTAQLHIADGVASEDAPEIAYAERQDHRGREAALYILAEPDRPGSEPHIGDLVSRIGEEFLDGEGSLTGMLQRVVRDRHDELLEWNRSNLPRDQASYGLSCLLTRDGDVYLMQIGPCLAYYRRGGRLLRRRPTAEGAREPLGGAETSAPEFSQLQLGPEDWVLLISSDVTRTVGEEAIGQLRDLPVEDVLPALYPKLRALERVSALVVAPGAGRAATLPSPLVEEEPAEPVPGLEFAPIEESPIEQAPPEPDSEWSDPPARQGGAASAQQGEHGEAPATQAELPPAPPKPVPLGDGDALDPQFDGPDHDPAADDDDDDEEAFPERTSLGAALGGFLTGLGGVFKRHPRGADDPWGESEFDAGLDDPFGVDPSAAAADSWAAAPATDTDVSFATGAEPPPEDAPIAAAPEETEIAAPAGPDSLDRDEALPDAATAVVDAPAVHVGEPQQIIDEPIAPIDPIEDDDDDPPAAESGSDGSAADTPPDEGLPHDSDDLPGETGADTAASEPPDPEPPTDEPPADDPTEPEATAETTTPGSTRNVEYRLERDTGGPGALETQAAGWPTNPFTTPAAPVLETGQDADRARFPRHVFPLEGRMPRFRSLRRASTEEQDDQPVSQRRGWGALALAVLAAVAVLGVVVGVLLVPDLLENSEQSRFEESLQDTRRGLTAAALTTDAAAGRAELTAAQTALQSALELRPLDESALALQQEVSTALSQINAVVPPPDLVEVTNLSGRVPPPLALSLVQAGADALFLLDVSGERVFALPLGGGEPVVIFEAGQRYPLLFLFDGPEAGAPVGMHWAVGAGGPALTILDANAQLYRFTAAEGMQAIEVPNRELIGSPDAVAVDVTGIHVLDVAGGSIWRFQQLSDGTLLEPSQAITRTDLGNAGSLVISGDSLFVSGADGRIRRFSNGVDQGFPLLDLDRPLLVPDSLAIGALTGLVYSVDRGNNRVAVFSAAGQLIAQLRADELAGVRGVVPDEVNDRLYFITADAVLTSTIPPIISN